VNNLEAKLPPEEDLCRPTVSATHTRNSAHSCYILHPSHPNNIWCRARTLSPHCSLRSHTLSPAVTDPHGNRTERHKICTDSAQIKKKSIKISERLKPLRIQVTAISLTDFRKSIATDVIAVTSCPGTWMLDYVGSFDDVHKMNAYRARVWSCLFVRKFQFKNPWIDVDKIWYGRYATGGHPELAFLNYQCELLRRQRHYRHLIQDPEITYGNKGLLADPGGPAV
jgi:hypothetical protein